MAKKNKNLPAVEGEVVNAALQDAQLGSAPAPQPKQKKDKNKTKKPNVFQRIGRAFKEMFSEMKKVTWLKPNDTVKRWGVVLLVVLVFLVVITGFDALCNFLLKLLIPDVA
ncbi:MAG: preprotein translocase subunit SecE [Eubacteriales bacterium]|nr:preprotein translocase subunit SecE [Eubacteriales bacterium]